MNFQSPIEARSPLSERMKEAALSIVRETGQAPSLREIARRCGVSATASYRHFGSHGDLLSAAWVDGFAQMREAITSNDRKAVAYVDFALAHPALFRIMFERLRLDRAPSLRAAAERLGATLIDEDGCEGWAAIHGVAELAVAGIIGRDDALRMLEGAP